MKNNMLHSNEKIKNYWNKRSEQNKTELTATTNDVYLRELEIQNIITTLHHLDSIEIKSVVDVGCGDGHTLIKLAEHFPKIKFLGIDYSENMIESAKKYLEDKPQLRENIEFMIGDVLELKKVLSDRHFDIIMTDRCLINLETAEQQSLAIDQISEHVSPGGYYLAIENFIEGHDNMNQARKKVGLSEIPIRWHNRYFTYHDFVEMIKKYFTLDKIINFSSSYYFATRVIYSQMCQMKNEQPDYNHEIHQLAIHLPEFGEFSPIKMAILRKK